VRTAAVDLTHSIGLAVLLPCQGHHRVGFLGSNGQRKVQIASLDGQVSDAIHDEPEECEANEVKENKRKSSDRSRALRAALGAAMLTFFVTAMIQY
jgi:hypothetical protein